MDTTKNLNIAIISGGTGNDALVKGLKSLYHDVNITVVVNAYDSGKSTGVCRKVTDTLGVSDIRKNHTRMYKAMTSTPDERLLEFYDKRYNFTLGNEVIEICSLLDAWGLSQFKIYVENFFKNETAKNFEYVDFSVANIIYSQMYREIGYEETNRIFCELLGIDDFVVLNSFDNVYLNAHLEDGTTLYDEGDIVELKNADNKIVSLSYVGETSHGINPKAIEAIDNADLIVVSTGTFWSSIYPTLEYLDFYKYINNATAKKIWAINCMEDKDAYGVSSNDFIRIVKNLGLNLSDFTILLNSDAVESLKLPNDEMNCIYEHMENNSGKHNGYKYAKNILKIYYGLFDEFDKIIFDFDDTLWSRLAKENDEELKHSIHNLNLINDKLANKAIIVSGNSFDSIKEKLYRVFGTNLKEFKVPIWADANSTLFIGNEPIQFIDELSIADSADKLTMYFKYTYGLNLVPNDNERVACLKLKPLDTLCRNVITNMLNDYLFERLGIEDCLAFKTGYSTIDILHRNNTKGVTYDYANLNQYKILYIGDEVGVGNDADIAAKCDNYIHISGVSETATILKLLTED